MEYTFLLDDELGLDPKSHLTETAPHFGVSQGRSAISLRMAM